MLSFINSRDTFATKSNRKQSPGLWAENNLPRPLPFFPSHKSIFFFHLFLEAPTGAFIISVMYCFPAVWTEVNRNTMWEGFTLVENTRWSIGLKTNFQTVSGKLLRCSFAPPGRFCVSTTTLPLCCYCYFCWFCGCIVFMYLIFLGGRWFNTLM